MADPVAAYFLKLLSLNVHTKSHNLLVTLWLLFHGTLETQVRKSHQRNARDLFHPRGLRDEYFDVGTKTKTLGKTMVNANGHLHLINQDTITY